MSRSILQRNNWYDGQQIDETDMDLEQTAWHDSLANNTDFLAGSGVEQEFVVQRVLFNSDDVPASISTLISTQNFDGEPIYQEDSFDQVVYLQPSDSVEGNQLEVNISDAALDGAPVLKVYIFGLIFGGVFTQEVLTFEKNESQITRNYFTNIIAIMTQDFRGNQNTVIDGVGSRNVGGTLTIKEALAMSVFRDNIMAEQIIEPNQDYIDFKPATPSKTLDMVLGEIADAGTQNVDDLNINVNSTSTRKLPKNDSTGLVVGQKFKATTNNIQKVQILLSVEENTLALPGHEFDWSGDLVLGIRRLQTTTTCPTDIIPGTAIEFDPEPSPLAEVSFDQNDLANLGISLDDTPRVVDFVFTQSLLANPNIEPSIIPGQYYVLTIRRSGNTSVGDIILQEAANTNIGDAADEMRMTVFSQNKWTDIPENDMWFRVFTDAIRVTDGTAFDRGVQITLPKVRKNDSTGLDEPTIEGFHSLIDVSSTAYNYVVVQRANNFTRPEPHPSTGNLVFTRIEDVPDVAIISEDTLTTLIDAGNNPIILGAVRDTNPINNPPIVDFTSFPGLVTSNTFTIINPNSDILVNNVVGSILTPNTNEPDLQYRIIKVQIFDDAYGDVNGDGVIDLNDVARAQILDGYSKDLESGALPSIDQKAAIVAGTVTMQEILRADVTGDGIINIFDPQAIQQNIALGTPFNAGSTFKRAVLTVENLVNPLTTTPDILGNDSVFNDVPFTNVEYQVDFVPVWLPSNIEILDLRRFVPKTFTVLESTDITSSPKNGGKNTTFIPGDMLLQGELLQVDGSPYAIDLEVNNIVIELPEGSTQGELDIFNNFIKNQMTFSDGTLVPLEALENNQVKVVASIQSIAKDRDGYDFESIDGYSAIHETVSILYTQSSGLLRIRAAHIRYITTRPELRTKIILSVYLKKAGFKNTDITVTPSKLSDLLIPI